MNLRRVATLMLGGMSLSVGSAAAQARFGVSVHASAAFASVNRQTIVDTTRLTGTLVGLEAAARYRRFELRGRYAQGSIEEDGGGVANDLVEGELMLGFRPVANLSVRFGPRARSFVTDSGTLRWVFWEARARFETDLTASGSLWSYVEGWFSLAGSINAAETFGSGRGLEGGLGFALGSTPLKLQVGYRVDRGGLDNDVRAEAVDVLQFSVGIGR